MTGFLMSAQCCAPSRSSQRKPGRYRYTGNDPPRAPILRGINGIVEIEELSRACRTLNHTFKFIDFSNRSAWPTWQVVPCLTSHHSGVEAPEAECQDFCLDADALALSLARPNKKALGIRDIRWDLVGPSIALLQSYPVVFSKPTDRQRATEQSFSSVAYSSKTLA